MITIDVTETSFIEDLDVAVANQWMSDNVGDLIHDDEDLAYGVGWRLEHEPACNRWVLFLENDQYASLFLLRWS